MFNRSKRFPKIDSVAPPVGAYDPREAVGFRGPRHLSGSLNDLSTTSNGTPNKALFKKPSDIKKLEKHLQLQLKQAKDENELKSKELQKAQERIKDLSAKCEKIPAINDLHKQLENNQKHFEVKESSLKCTVDNLQFELKRAKDEIHSKSEELQLNRKEFDLKESLLKSTLEDLRLELTQAKDDLHLKSEEFELNRKDICNKESSLKSTIEDLQCELKEAKDDIHLKTEEFCNKESSLKSTIEDLQCELKEAKDDLHLKSEELSLNKKDFCNKESSLKSTIEDLQCDLNHARKQIEDLQLKCQKVTVLQAELEEAKELNDNIEASIEKTKKMTEGIREEYDAKLTRLTSHIQMTENQLAESWNNNKLLRKKLDELAKSQQADRDAFKRKLKFELEDLKIHSQQLEKELQLERKEGQSLREKYHSLLEKVGPFEEQLDAYQRDINELYQGKATAQKDMDRLALEYAKILGHTNQKQKIQRVEKLMQENRNLKGEIEKLRELNHKEKRHRVRAEDALRRIEGKKRPVSAKENYRQTLRDSN